MTNPHPIAVIDGMLCRLSLRGNALAKHAPLATAVMEFHHGSDRIYVREHPYGLLPGVTNLYSVDSDFRLLWLAEWPASEPPCAKIVAETAAELVVESLTGSTLRFDVTDGRLLSCTAGAKPSAVASPEGQPANAR
ncbi:hypothetical protein [Opitutus sp. ER46]|uniref:hypothetical protein n=1 Tax=Opitutus sp. ER46 TaxID=2161864 RepID=UPI0011B22C6E|nr:hypothetical protein [Opitutus sp. ER46]